MATAKFKLLKRCLKSQDEKMLAIASEERIEVYHDPKEQIKRPTVTTPDV